MPISTLNVEDAVLLILADLRIPASGKLCYATLVKQWRGTHLRFSDLADGVRRLVSLQELRDENSPDGRVLTLTNGGHQRAMAVRSQNTWRNRLRMFLLELDRPWPQATPALALYRRAGDRVEPRV